MPKLEMLTPQNSAIALIDYQPAMYQGVQSHDRIVTFNNIQILAKAAKLFKIPTVLTTVAKDSFSGPFMPEVTELFPNHDIIDRTSMNSWLNAGFRKAVAATGRKKFVIAGLWTEACVMFPTLDMLKEGYEIYISADACGDLSLEAHNRAMDRAVQAGAVPITSAINCIRAIVSAASALSLALIDRFSVRFLRSTLMIIAVTASPSFRWLRASSTRSDEISEARR